MRPPNPLKWMSGALVLAFFLLPAPPCRCQDPEWLANRKSQTDILEEADSIFLEVSQLRGKPILQPVATKFENRSFFENYYRRQLEELYPPSKKRNTENAYALLGFLPQRADLIQTYLDSFLGVVDGLYDPKTKTLYIADWIQSGSQEETLAHELTHALQDQYFNLQNYLDRGAELSLDAQFARAAVMEGEAVAISLNYSLEDKGTDFTRLKDIAAWVKLSNLLRSEGKRALGQKVVLHQVVSFPYVYGAAFLQKYIKSYGWQGMDALFRHPPDSTHQIMHPETFFPRRQNPVGIVIEDLSAGVLVGREKIWDDTLGEWGLQTLLGRYLPETSAGEAVKGWRGDRIQVYEDGATHGLLSVGYVLFNGEADADDFFRAYKEYLQSKYGIDKFKRTDETIFWADLSGGSSQVYVERFGRRAVFIEGAPPDLTAKVRGELWKVFQTKKK